MLKIKQLKGRINYVEALNKMNSKVLEVSEDIKNEEIWFLEHQSVFTAGSSTPKNFNKNTELQSWSYPLGQAANLHIMLSHDNCDYFEQVVPYEDHEHGAKTFIRTNQKGEVTVNPDPGLGIEIDWEVIHRDWYSYLKLDQNGLKAETRTI